MARPRLLFLTKYGALGASARYRVFQYLRYLRDAGFECEVCPLFPEALLSRKYAGYSGRGRLVRTIPPSAISLLRRWWLLQTRIREFDAAYVESEALPYLPAAAERGLFRTPVIVDYGDAIAVRYQEHGNALARRMLGSKIGELMARSEVVIAANEHLAAWAATYNRNVTVIPTAVDLQRYPAGAPRSRPADPAVVGWIGTPITAEYLRLLERPLSKLAQRHRFVLKVIGAPGFTMEGIDVVSVPWSEATEVAQLRSCDIGVMPLPDDAWARGKSALKIIQYMASSIPAVASAVGTNKDVIKEGETGLLAATDEEWVDKLSLLMSRPDIWGQLASAGRQTVEERYSVQSQAPRLVDVFQRALRSRHRHEQDPPPLPAGRSSSAREPYT